MESLSLDSDSVLTAAALPTHKAHECAIAILNLQCKLLFPACEIGTETRSVCRSACNKVEQKCADTEFAIKSLDICDSSKIPEKGDTPSCVGLSYNGANHMLWIAGFSIALTFSFLAALGLNLQKLSMNREETLPPGNRRPPIKQPIWVIGLSLITSGSLLDFVAFGMAPQSLLAPLGALSLVWNLLIAPLFNNEKLTRQNLVATAIIVGGTLMTVIFAAHSTPTYTLEDLMGLYKEPVMIFYMIFTITLLTGMRFTLLKLEKDLPLEEHLPPPPDSIIKSAPTSPASPSSPPRTSAVGNFESSTPSKSQKPNSSSMRSKSRASPTPMGSATSGSSEKPDASSTSADANPDGSQFSAQNLKRIICYGGIAGVFGGQSVLFAKSTAELVKNVMVGSDDGAFKHPMPYFIIIAMAICLITQITTLNSGLSKFNALLMVPVYQSFWNIFSVLGGIIYFQEYRDLSPAQSGFFLTGILTTLSGVAYLLKERSRGIESGYVVLVDHNDSDSYEGSDGTEEDGMESGEWEGDWGVETSKYRFSKKSDPWENGQDKGNGMGAGKSRQRTNSKDYAGRATNLGGIELAQVAETSQEV